MERTYEISGLNATFSYPIWKTAEIEETFLELAEQWRRETGMMSLVTKMSMHPAYQRIIGMGQAVVPLILRELEQEPDHWFWALQAITGANPVESEQRGRLKQMAEAWIQWGRENGYRWQAGTV
ncbi:hypothetical protein [Tychonema sp. LEGE 07203]|uniref:hypothetical protein n=1 Tax=Tychonema sp. LEGE 07203 TaxID=1828671 RepID=UPI0018824C2D|nr:hypothetical protein [Tychonema sp. LEGE 07203]MBE9096320.1 hypothetical protein [Tychonema sp. LEGE 07203]